MSNKKNLSTADEAARLNALKQYGVLDSLPEKQYDDLTRLASIICETPITLISLIDEDRQWFKSKVGIDGSGTARELAFCRYTILENGIFEVENSLEDERFVNNPFVTGDPNVRFYAGAPLTTPEGYNIGTLCVIDTKPRKLTPQQREALSILANEVVINLELRKEKSKLIAQNTGAVETNKLLTAFFENSPSAILMTDMQGKYIYANRNALNLVKRNSLNEVIGKSTKELFPKHLAAEISLVDEEVLRTKKGLRKEYQVGFNESATHYITHSFPLVNESNEIYGVGSATIDVTTIKKTELELQKSNERFSKLFDSSPIEMAIIDLSTQKYIKVNKAFLRTFEFDSESEVINKTALELCLINEEEWNFITQLLKENDELHQVEITCHTKNKIELAIMSSATKMQINGDQLSLLSFIDVSEKKRLEGEIKRSNILFTSLFEHSPIGVSLTEAISGKIKMANNSFLQLFGYELSEVLDKTSAELRIVDNPGLRSGLMDKIKDGGRIKDHELEIYRKNREKIICLGSHEVIKINDELFLLSAFLDITHRKKMEEELMIAREQAEKANFSKSSFLANMSHEIRTPLNAILGFADLLERTSLNAQQKDYLLAIDTSGKNLLTIINDILDFSKIEAGMLSIEKIPFSPQQLIQSLYTMLQPKAQSKSIGFHVSVDSAIPHLVNGDPTRLNQILINLVGNAVKFTEYGSVTVSCQLFGKREKNVTLRFSVKDSGIGIVSEKIEKIFDRFTQADSDTTRNFGGTGLGLSIAKKLVELQGGKISVTSELTKGSEFVFTIDYEIAAASESAYVPQQPQVDIHLFKGKKILIVEDNAINQKLTTTILTEEGIVSRVAENGQKALDILYSDFFDVILMDLQMPVLDGYQTTKKIRQELKLRTPIIAMTANAMTGERERCLSLGMNGYITKPFKAEVLFSTLSKIFNNNSNRLETDKDTESFKQEEKITNLIYLKEFYGDKESLIKETIEMFLEQNPQDVSALESASVNKDYSTLKEVSHGLQTSLGFMGVSSAVLNEVKLLEAAAKDNDSEVISEKLPNIVKLCRQACNELLLAIKQMN